MDQGTGNRNPLPLSAGEIRRALFNKRLVAIGHAFDEFLSAGQAGCIDRVGQSEARAAGDDVLADRSPEEEILLQDNSEALPQMPQVDLTQIGAINL